MSTDTPPTTEITSPRERQIGMVVALGAVVGLLVAVAAVGFLAAVQFLNDWLLISPRSRMMFPDERWLTAATVLVPALGGLVVGVLHRMIMDRRPHTPVDVIAAVQTRRGRLQARPGILSALGALVSLGSGASVGQYGPLVHMGGTLGSLSARGIGASRSEDNIAIACGVAAAIATAFKAPIAGILFAHEVVLRHYALRAFAPVAAAAIAGFVVEDVVFGRRALFYLEAARVAHAWEYVAFLLMGAVGALVAAAYMHALLAAARLSRRVPIPAVLRPAFAGAAVGTAALWLPEILGIGKETLRFATIAGAYENAELVIILAAKILATALCIGFGFGGGVFSPALVIGTLFGALCGVAVTAVAGAPTATASVYAICGMVAVTAPVIGAPLTTVLIVFELTGSYTLTTASLATVALANVTGNRIFGRSLFDVQLRDRGLDLSAGRGRAYLQGKPVRTCMSKRCVTLAGDTTVDAAISRLAAESHSEAFVLTADGGYRGTVTLAALEGHRDSGAGGQPVAGLANDPRPVLGPETSLWEAMATLGDFVGEALPVVEPQGAFVGVVYEADLTSAYLHTLDELRDEENA